MKESMKLKKKLDLIKNCKLFTNGILVLFLILSTDTILFKTNQEPLLRYISWTLICISAFVGILFQYHRLGDEFIYLILMCAAILLSMSITQDLTGGYIFKIVLLIFGLCFTRWIELKTFSKLYIWWMKLIAIVSLLAIVFQSDILHMKFIPTISNGLYTFKSLGLTNLLIGAAPVSAGIPLVRNYGPFWEPGVFQIYLVIALIFSLFLSSKINYIDCIIFGVTILTTFSTAGYIVLVIVLLAFFYKKGYIGTKVLIIISILIILVVLLVNKDLSRFVLGKLTGSASSADSTNARWYSLISNIYISIIEPLGVGPNNLEAAMTDFKTTFGINVNFTNVNGLLQNFIIFGIPFGLIYTYRLYRFVKGIACNTIVAFILFVAVILEMSNEPLLYSAFFCTVLFYSTSNLRFRRRIDESHMVNKRANSIDCK